MKRKTIHQIVPISECLCEGEPLKTKTENLRYRVYPKPAPASFYCCSTYSNTNYCKQFALCGPKSGRTCLAAHAAAVAQFLMCFACNCYDMHSDVHSFLHVIGFDLLSFALLNSIQFIILTLHLAFTVLSIIIQQQNILLVFFTKECEKPSHCTTQ